MERKSSPLGVVSFVATYLVVAILALTLGSFGEVWRELGMLLSGGALDIPKGSYSSFASSLFVLVAIELPLCMATGVMVSFCLGECKGKHAVSSALLPSEETTLFKAFTHAVVLEELFARFLFLGILTHIPGLRGTIAFYLLFGLGNGIWSLVHLGNYKNKRDWHWARVLPQFVGGVFFTYAYLKWGLVGALVTHFASNAVLFSLAKEQAFGLIDCLTLLYSGVCAAIAFMLLDRPVGEALYWLEATDSYALPGWGFKEYLCLFVFLTMTLTAGAEMLLYDKSNLKRTKRGSSTDGSAEKGCALVGGLGIIIGLFVGAWKLLQHVLRLLFRRFATRVGILGVWLCFLQEARSANAVARTFWVGVPAGFLMVAICVVLPFWQACGFLALSIVVEVPLTVLKAYDN